MLFLVVASCQRDNPVYERHVEPAAPYVAGELLVRFSAALSADDVAARIEPWGGVVLSDLSGDGDDDLAFMHLGGSFRLGLPTHVSVEDAMEMLALEGDLDFAEPNYIVEAFTVPNDEFFGRLWGMNTIGAPAAWDLSQGSADVVVGVIDTGVLYTHPDLRDNMWTNPGEIPGNGVDDDGNGYIDDVHGWDFCNNDADPIDDHYHGTHCAGTIAGRGDNGEGVVGVSWRARIMALKFLCANGSGSIYAAGLAVRYAADNHATFTSNSWGGGGYSTTFYNVLQYAQARGQLFVAAAGNSNQNMDVYNSYPAGYDLPNVISVAASDSGDRRASFSNYGRTRVDLAAPGVSIYSSMLNDSYGYLSGTSMAAPHVSGALALLYGHSPNLSWEMARDALLSSVDVVDGWGPLVATGGRLNVARMLQDLTPPPPQVVGVEALHEGGGMVRVQWWRAPDEAVDHYRVYLRSEAGQQWPVQVVQTREITELSTGPLPDGVWFATVAAVSVAGEGEVSAPAEVVIRDEAAPGQILDLTAYPVPGEPVEVASVQATSDFGVGWPVDDLLDGDPSTGWVAQPTETPVADRVSLDLGEVTTLAEVALRPLAGFGSLFPRGVEIRTAVRAGDWTVVARDLGQAPPAFDDWRRWRFAAVEARFVELRFIEPAEHEAGLFYVALGEVALTAPSAHPDQVRLGWTAPGDDGSAGIAMRYDLRVAEGLMVEGFDAAPTAEAPAPQMAGTRQSATLSGLAGDAIYGVAIAAIDDAGQRGAVSPVVRVVTGMIPPGGIENLQVSAAGPGAIRLQFVAPAADGHDASSGRAASYEVRWSERPITGATWPEALSVVAPAPSAPGAMESFVLDGLPEAAIYHVRIAALDSVGTRGPWSEDASADAPVQPDEVAPAVVQDLTAAYVSASAHPAPLMPTDDGYVALVDGDEAEGFMAEVADEVLAIDFDLGAAPVALTRVRLLPHLLYPGDFPSVVTVSAVNPQTGAQVELARRELAAAPGEWASLDFAPIDVTRFTVHLSGGPERFGARIVALAELEAYAGQPGGGVARLTWVAPGDDGFLGTATGYDLRMAGAAMNDLAAFDAAASAGEQARPLPGGTLEVTEVADLPEAGEVFFALRTVDEVGHWSGLSNPARIELPGYPPAAVSDLRVVSVERTAVVLAFTATGDDGALGQASRYDFRYLAGALDAAGFPQATVVPMAAPQAAGVAEQVRVEGLSPGVYYTFGLLAFDEAELASGLSNVASATTVEATPPSRVLNLAASLVGDGGAQLTWTAPGDDGDVGRAASYELRWSDAPLNAANFAAATAAQIAAPQVAGAQETALVQGLPMERTLFFALRATDDVGNVSELSNVAQVTTPGVPPAAVADLMVVDRGEATLTLAFTATGDDGVLGQAARYDLRWALAPIVTDVDFAAATPAATPVPAQAGQGERVVVDGLASGTRHHLAIVVEDAEGNRSARSASVSGDTLDVTPPEGVQDLVAAALVNGQGLSAPVSDASSAYSPATDAAGLTDDNPSSLWISAATAVPTPEYVVFDLGAVSLVNRVRLRSAEGYAELFPATFELQAAVEADAFETFLSVDGAAVGEDEALERRFAPVEARWIRLAVPQGTLDGERYLVAVGGVELFAGDAGATAIDLTWTAPADQGPEGQAARYMLRYSDAELTAQTFAAATPVATSPARAAGQPERVSASALSPETRYWFGVVAIDAGGNEGPLSNIASAVTAGLLPGTINDLAAQADGETIVRLMWTAPGASGDVGQAARYELRYSLGVLTEETWAQAVPVEVGAPNVPGTVETQAALGLNASTIYRFAVRAYDAAGSAGALSNVVTVRTNDPPERIPPSMVDDLQATAVAGVDGAIHLSWKAPGDDGDLGLATDYELRWALAPITAQNFAGATLVQTPAPRAAGSAEHLDVTDLPWETEIFFALRALDELGNVSLLSNVASAETRAVPPSRIDDLSFGVVAGRPVLSWTAVGADRLDGQAARYEIYLRDRAFAGVVGLTPVADAPAPQMAGTAERYETASLTPDVTWYAAVRAVDAHGHVGELSGVVELTLPDVVPPGAVVNLTVQTGARAGELAVRFVSPGDDEMVGTAARYELRWSTAPFDAAGFEAATLYAGLLRVVEGAREASLTLTNLPDERELYVALRAVDNADNLGPVSVVMSARTPDVAPARIGGLAAASDGAAAVRLSWTAPGDDGDDGQAARYELRWGLARLTDANFDAATLVVTGAPRSRGEAETARATGLASGQTFHFAIRAFDERGNAGTLSASVTATTEDITAPGVVGDLTAATASAGRLDLSWTAAGDDGGEGRVAAVEVRVAPLPWPGFEAAQIVVARPALRDGGQPQTVTLSGLDDELEYGVALVSVDEAGNRSAPSNVATAWTAAVAPGAVGALAVEIAGPGALRLSWTAPADDGHDAASGAVVRYEVAVAQAAFAARDFEVQPLRAGPAPVAPGAAQTLVVSGLVGDAEYWLAVRAIDDRGTLGEVTVVVSAFTPDVSAPAAVASLIAEGPHAGGDPLPVATVTASATLSAAWSAIGAFDDDLASAWATGVDDEIWIEARLRAASRVGGLRLYVGEFTDGFPRGFTVRADGVVVAQVGDLAVQANRWVDLAFAPVSAEVVRITVDRLGGEGDYVVLNELQILPADDAPDSVVLTWVAPGDDGGTGQASAYDLRASTAPITAANFAAATAIDAPDPAEAGALERLRVEDLAEETAYYFAVVTEDDAGNRSGLSNIALASTAGVPPAPIDDLAAEADGVDAVVLSWTAPGASRDEGLAARYEVRYRAGGLSDATWAEGVPVDAPAPQIAGAAETLRVDGLLPGTLYAFAVRAVDARDNTALLSVVALALTAPAPDVVPPAAVEALSVRAASGDGQPLEVVEVTASGSQFPDYPQSAAVDADPSTAWASPARGEAGQETLTLRLAQVVAVGEVQMLPHADFVGLFPSDFALEGSVDGQAWTTLYEAAGTQAVAGRWQVAAWPAEGVAYVRLRADRIWRDPAFLTALAEIAVFEAAAAGTVTVTFRAAGDDGLVGTADHYIVGRSNHALHEGNWGSADTHIAEVAPGPAGAPQAITIDGLAPGTHHFAVRAVDEVGQMGPVGASVSVTVE